MASLQIKGGQPLRGEITPAGNKNAVLPMMASCVLTDQECVLSNVPQIADVEAMTAILKSLGAVVEQTSEDQLTINCEELSSYQVEPRLATRLRASILLLGPLLARFGQAELPSPGGDVIGKRAIDTHLEAFKQLGADLKEEKGVYHLRLGKTPLVKDLFLDEASVTATENVVMFAASRSSKITLRNAAAEPHVVNLAAFLTGMGAGIRGAGTNTITIEGNQTLAGAQGEVGPDQIEIGTFVIGAAITGGEIKIRPVQPENLQMILTYCQRLGVDFNLDGDRLQVFPSALKSSSLGKFKTGPWPGFPSDLMSPFIVLATQTRGLALCHDWMYDWRLFFVDQLIRMGAEIIICDPHRLLVSGRTRLRGREMESPDIRAGMALVLAALCADGVSLIHRVEHIDRGYPQLEKRLGHLGAAVSRLED